MTAYNTQNAAIPGLLVGLEREVDSGLATGAISFGVPVFNKIGDSTSVYPTFKETSKIVLDADLVTSNSIAISLGGVSLSTIVFATSHLATMNAIANAIIGAGYEAVLDTADVNNRTLLVRKAGVNIAVTFVVTLGASQAVATITYDTSMVFVGVSVFQQRDQGAYALKDSVSILRDGDIWASVEGTIKDGGKVYLNLSTGKFTSVSTHLEITNAVFKSAKETGDVAIVRIENQVFTALSAKF